jgi:hypothetical protein
MQRIVLAPHIEATMSKYWRDVAYDGYYFGGS